MTNYYTSDRHDASAHNLSMITGYIVEETIREGERLAEPLTKHALTGADKYGEAIELARSYRKFENGKISRWAVIRAVYADGCISEPF